MIATATHPAVQLIGSRMPAHDPGAYPRLSCCGGPVLVVEWPQMIDLAGAAPAHQPEWVRRARQARLPAKDYR